MFKALKNSFNSLGEMLDKHYAKQIEKDLKKGKVVDHRRPFGQVLVEDILVNRVEPTLGNLMKHLYQIGLLEIEALRLLRKEFESIN